MARPTNQYSAAREANALLVRRLPGSRRGSVRAHLQRAVHIAETIWRRWQIGPYQWQVKHLRWYLSTQMDGFTPGNPLHSGRRPTPTGGEGAVDLELVRES